MTLPGPPSLLFLAYLLFYLPWKASVTARRLRAAYDAPSSPDAVRLAAPSRPAIWISTLIGLALLFVLAWVVGSGFGFRIFALPEIGSREIGFALAALAACFAVRAVLRRFRSEEERRRLLVYRWVPRTPGEWLLRTLTVLAASVAEEAAYRGVGMAILTYMLGNAWIAALLCAAAFALAHWPQGGKSGAAIFAIALVMHALVALTGTLVLAMAVHFLYDLAAGALIARQKARDEALASCLVGTKK